MLLRVSYGVARRGLLSQPLMTVGEAEVTRLRHTPASSVRRVRPEERRRGGGEGVTGQEGGEMAETEAAAQLDDSHSCCFISASWLFAGDRSKPSNNGCNHHAVYGLACCLGSHAASAGRLRPLVPALTRACS